jgi:anti-anti-sigma factor
VLPQPYEISCRADGPGVVRVSLTGEFDLENSAELAAVLHEVADDPAVDRVTLDMAGTTFIDSSGVRAVMNAHHAACQGGKSFRVASWSRGVRRLFELLELADALEQDPDPTG